MIRHAPLFLIVAAAMSLGAFLVAYGAYRGIGRIIP